MNFFQILFNYKEAFVGGAIVTFQISLLVWSIGLVVGTLLGVLSVKNKESVGLPLKIISFIFSGIPILVLLFWLHFPLQSILEIEINPFWTTVLALSVVNIFYVSDIIRGALEIFPKQYIESAKTLGLSSIQTLFQIQMPIIARQILPNIITAQANILHLTLFASLISVQEIFRVAQSINALIYKPVEIYSILVVFFIIILLPINGLALYLKVRYSKHEN